MLKCMQHGHEFLYQGTSIRYWEYNPGGEVTILMVHGFRGTHHGLEKLIEQLPGYRIVVPDLPGFGASQAFSDLPHSLKSYVAFLQAFLRHAAPDQPPVLLGHSFGSIVATHYAVRYGSSISRLILVNPIGAPALSGPRSIMTRLAIVYYWLGRVLPPALGRRWLGSSLIVRIMSEGMAKTKNKHLRAYIHQQHLQHFSTFASADVVAESFKASVSHDVREVATRITVPTLLIAGEYDDITPLQKEVELNELMPDSRLHVIKNVGHLIHYETPIEAADAIIDFLGDAR